MPSAKRIGWAQLRVGILAIAALLLIVITVVLLTSTKKLFSDTAPLYTYMRDSAALAPASPVRLNGILVGKVDNVELSGESDPNRTIKVTMSIERDKFSQIPVDSIASISAENVLGTKFILIRRGQSSVPAQPNGEIPALDTRGFEEVVEQSYALLASLQGILKRIDAVVSLVEAGQGSIGKLLVDETLYNRLVAILTEAQRITTALSTPHGTIGKLLYEDELYSDVRGSMAKLDSVIVGLQQGEGTAGKFLKDEKLYQELNNTVAELRKTVQGLNAGEGTAGKLLRDDQLYKQLQGTLDKVDNMIGRINSGQGTIGQLLVNPQLYDSLNGVSAEAQQLIRDIRANPKKFLRIKLALF
jgi:phospholipid/cholesterol/gamma-HCH transport system substrate-binding protein